MNLREIYTYFLQARELLLQTYEDYPYGEDWTSDDIDKFERALSSYNNYYLAIKDYMSNHPNLNWKSEETKNKFMDDLKEIIESDMKVYNSLKIRNKWHKEFEANLQSILVRMSRALASDIFIQVPRGKGKFYMMALETLIKELCKDNVKLVTVNKSFTPKKYNLEYLTNANPNLTYGHLNDQDYTLIWKAYKYVRTLAVKIFDGLTSTNESKGFNGYGFQGKKYVPSYCAGGIDLNRQDWLRLKDAYDDVNDYLDYGAVREKRIKFAELESAECPYSKNQLITSVQANYAWYKKYYENINESYRSNIKTEYDRKNKRILFKAKRNINTGDKFIF